jgi:hypothetical protein
VVLIEVGFSLPDVLHLEVAPRQTGMGLHFLGLQGLLALLFVTLLPLPPLLLHRLLQLAQVLLLILY